MLRPIDMTLTVQHAADAARAGGSQALRPEVASQMFADRLEKQVKQQEQQVVESNKSEKGEIQERQGQGGGYDPHRKKRREKEKAKLGSQSKPTGESLYDIRI